jgi:pimeloyl-ACP methyl ester carboxylesterase
MTSVVMGPRRLFTLPRGTASIGYRDSGPAGDKPAIVLLHGVGVTSDLNWGAAYADLSRDFRVVAPDLPGHGRDVRPWPKFNIEDCADHIVALADSLGLDKFIVCGYSMGSLVAQQVWRGHPDRVSALVLGAASRNFLGSAVERMASSFSPLFAVAAQTNPVLRILRADAFGFGYMNDLDAEGRAYVHAEMSLTSMATVAAAVAAVGKFTSHDWISTVDVPVSVLVTTRDSLVPTSRQHKLAEAIPHATVVSIDGDHSVFIASPKLFAEKLLDACHSVNLRSA